MPRITDVDCGAGLCLLARREKKAEFLQSKGSESIDISKELGITSRSEGLVKLPDTSVGTSRTDAASQEAPVEDPWKQVGVVKLPDTSIGTSRTAAISQEAQVEGPGKQVGVVIDEGGVVKQLDTEDASTEEPLTPKSGLSFSEKSISPTLAASIPEGFPVREDAMELAENTDSQEPAQDKVDGGLPEGPELPEGDSIDVAGLPGGKLPSAKCLYNLVKQLQADLAEERELLSIERSRNKRLEEVIWRQSQPGISANWRQQRPSTLSTLGGHHSPKEGLKSPSGLNSPLPTVDEQCFVDEPLPGKENAETPSGKSKKCCVCGDPLGRGIHKPGYRCRACNKRVCGSCVTEDRSDDKLWPQCRDCVCDKMSKEPKTKDAGTQCTFKVKLSLNVED